MRSSHAILLLPLALGACEAEADEGAKRVWHADSTEIELRSFGYWPGGAAFRARRDQLDSEQLSALEGVRTMPAPEPGSAQDLTEHRVTIRAARNAGALYYASDDNARVWDPLPTDAAGFIDEPTLQPFLQTLRCTRAQAWAEFAVSPPGVEAGPGRPDGGVLPMMNLPLQPGCLHGVFAAHACQDLWMRFEIPAPGSYHFALERCFERRFTLRLFDDAQHQLAVSAAGCPTLDHEFNAAGTYVMALEKRSAAGCEAGPEAGDVYLIAEPR